MKSLPQSDDWAETQTILRSTLTSVMLYVTFSKPRSRLVIITTLTTLILQFLTWNLHPFFCNHTHWSGSRWNTKRLWGITKVNLAIESQILCWVSWSMVWQGLRNEDSQAVVVLQRGLIRWDMLKWSLSGQRFVNLRYNQWFVPNCPYCTTWITEAMSLYSGQ